MAVIGASGDRLVDTGTATYRALVPVQRLRDSKVRAAFLDDLLKPSPRGYVGQDKVLFLPPGIALSPD